MKRILSLMLVLSILSTVWAQTSSLEEAIKTKMTFVKNNPVEHQKAVESGWYLQMEQTLKELKMTPSNRQIDDLIAPNPDCSVAQPICLETLDQYYLTTDADAAEEGPDYDCLGSEPNPTWFYFKTLTTETISLHVFAESDLDYIIWGPFSEPTCDYDSLQTVVDCSYSSTNDEWPLIEVVEEEKYYMMMVTNFSNMQQNFNFELISGSLDCTPYYNAEELSNVTGYAFMDENLNCSNDDDSPIPNALIKFSPGNHYTTTNELGYYDVFLPLGEYSVEFINLPLGSSACELGTISVTSTSEIYFFDVLYSTEYMYDAQVNIACPTLVDDATFYLNYTNLGMTQINGSIVVSFDSALTPLSATEEFAIIDEHTIEFTYSNLSFNEQRLIEIQTNTLDTLTYLDYVAETTAEIFSDEDDLNDLNNISTDFTTVQLPYDPNNIIASPYGSFEENFILETDNIITYTVNFQNTGSAPAHNVNVYDTVPSVFNRDAVQLVASSHDCEIYYESDNTLRFKFHNIELMDSLHNEPESHGFVMYQLITNTALNEGDEIENVADIYFDNNPPVRTNTVKLKVLNTSGIKVNTKSVLHVYPNPVEDILTIDIHENSNITSDLKIFSIHGKLVKSIKVEANKIQVSVKDLDEGVYFMQYNSNEKFYNNKIIVY